MGGNNYGFHRRLAKSLRQIGHIGSGGHVIQVRPLHCLAHPYITISIADQFMIEVVRLHGLPTSIVSDRDLVFVSRFWKELFRLYDTILCMSTTNHPHIDEQTESLYRSLETYLRCFAMERLRQWNCWLPWAEYWYNTSFQTATQTTRNRLWKTFPYFAELRDRNNNFSEN